MTHNKQFLQAILRQDFSSFIGKVFHTINPGAGYQPNWHIDLIANYLEAVRKGQIKRLIINMPPRALKSVCVSVAWPAWLIGHDPSARIMAASYSSILSIKHSLDCRLVVNASWYKELFPLTKLSKKHNQKSKFLTTDNGFRFATSVGGSATGEGGDILIIDDPHNPTQIHSKKSREKAIEWFEQTFVTRLNDPKKGAIVLVMQRLHEEDLSAHLTSSNSWELLKIPAIADKDYNYSILGQKYKYKQGNLLNSTRDDKLFLENLEREIGAKNFAAQLLQSPVSSSTSMVELSDIKFHSTYSGFDYYVLSWDTAIKISQDSDYSVGTCWGVSNDKYYLVSIIRRKMCYPELKSAIEQQIAKYSPKHVLIEDKASGQSLAQDLSLGRHMNIIPIRPKYDKITRFASTIPLFQFGRVFISQKTTINREIIKELTSFPNSRHDDIVDSISQFLNFMKKTQAKSKIGLRVL